jgi:signal transduction histidine kinase/CheY-like chemotaxis protein
MIPVLVVTALLVHRVVSDNRTATERQLIQVARTQAAAVDAEIDATIRALEILAQSTRIDANDLAGFYTNARRVQVSQASWLTVILLAPDGHQVMNTNVPLQSALPAAVDPDSLQRVLATRQPVVGTLRRGAGGRLGMPVRVPVVRDGAVRFVLTAVITPARIASVVNGGQPLSQEWTRAVVDRSGLILARTRDPERFVGQRATAQSLARFADGDEGVFTDVAIDGAEVTAAFSRGPVSGWISAVAVQQSVLDAPLRRSMTALAAVGLLLAVAGGLGVFLISRRVSHDIASAAQAAEALAAGHPVEVRRSIVTEVRSLDESLTRSAALLAAHERSRNDYVRQVEAARAEAEAANRAKDEFLAMLGHELRNPLAPVLTALQLMRMRGDTASLREREVIDRQVRHLARLVDDLLDVARLRGGKVQLQRARFELHAAVQRAVEIASPLIAERHHQLQVDVPQSGLVIDGDETRLAQVFANLLTNAAKYTEPEGRISMVARAEGNLAVIECIDNGAGIAEELRPRLFDLFAQGARTIDRQLGGLGLGLAVAKSLTQLHGGTIEVVSDGPGLGSRFTVRLPLAPDVAAPNPDAALTAPAPTPHVSKHVLVVDDNRDALEMLSGVLTLAGFTVLSAASGEAALAALPSFTPDVAVLDIGLPGMDGFELARALRSRNATIGLVAVTGYGQDSDITAAHRAGFDLHLVKPAAMEALTDFIRSHRTVK